MPALLQPRVPRAATRTRPCRAQVPSFLLCLPLPAHRARASLASLPSPATLGDICACCCDTGGNMDPPHSSLGAGQMLLLDSWTLWQGWSPRRLGLAGDGAGALARTKAQASGASVPAWAPQPCSAWGSAPPDHHSLTASPCWLCMAWGHVRTLSLPPDLSSHLGRPRPLSDPGLDRPCVGTDLTAALGGPCGTPAPSFHCKGLPQLCGHCPPYPGTHGGNILLIS